MRMTKPAEAPALRLKNGGHEMKKTPRRIAWSMLTATAVLAASAGAYGCVAGRALKREMAATPRDGVTGIVLGCEPIGLDPPAPASDPPTSACLLIHGFLGSRRDFSDLGARLAAGGYHVRLARLPGHGTTPRDFAARSPDEMLDGARDELTSLRSRYRSVTVVGFSMGGSLATLLAAEGGVDRLVLIAPYYGVTYRWFYVLRPEWWNAALGWAIPYVIRSDRFIKVNRPEARKEIYAYHVVPTRGVATLVELGRRARQPRVLEAVHCPTLLVMAEGDEASSPARAREAFIRLGSPVKQEAWFSRRNNHHILLDYDREQAKAAIANFIGNPGDSFRGKTGYLPEQQ